MPDQQMTLIGIAIITVVTYLTRISGYLIGTRIPEGSRLYRVIQTLPGCALSAVVAPALVHGNPLEITAICSAALFFYGTGRILSALLVGLSISIVGMHWFYS